MSMLKKLTDLAKSEKGKEFAEKASAKAKQMTNDPQTREKIDAAKRKITDRVGGDKPAADAPPSGPATTSTAGAPVDTGAPGRSAPTATPGGPTETGADSGDDDGGKAAA